MKIILSRKGFDSSYGGYPSPILPDGSLVSLPIPSMRYLDEDNKNSRKLYAFDGSPYELITYQDLNLPTETRTYLRSKGVPFTTYKDLMLQLLPKDRIKEPMAGKSKWFEKEVPWCCHLDPDLVFDVIEREKGWRPLFGQTGAAQAHLRKQEVGREDIFLFFGWFRKTKIITSEGEAQLVYDPVDPHGRHVIFGYFQVDEVLTAGDEGKVKPWMRTHPHIEKGLWESNNNALYVARKHLSWDSGLDGAGVFAFRKDLVLTETNPIHNPKQNRSIWKYSFLPEGTDITYHNDKSWVRETTEKGKVRKYFQSASRGQEFVISKRASLEKKVKNWIFEEK